MTEQIQLTESEKAEAEWWCLKYKETLRYLGQRMDEYIELSNLRTEGGWSEKNELDSADTSLQLLFIALGNINRYG